MDNWLIGGLEYRHIQKVREWRNAQISILRQDHVLTEEEQEAWWTNMCLTDYCKSGGPSQYWWVGNEVVEGRWTATSVFGLVHMYHDRGVAETSFLTDPAMHTDVERYVKNLTNALTWMFSFAPRRYGIKGLSSVTFTDIVDGGRPEKEHMAVLDAMFPFKEDIMDNGRPAVHHWIWDLAYVA